jgi:hypothetical protein
MCGDKQVWFLKGDTTVGDLALGSQIVDVVFVVAVPSNLVY